MYIDNIIHAHENSKSYTSNHGMSISSIPFLLQHFVVFRNEVGHDILGICDDHSSLGLDTDNPKSNVQCNEFGEVIWYCSYDHSGFINSYDGPLLPCKMACRALLDLVYRVVGQGLKAIVFDAPQ